MRAIPAFVALALAFLAGCDGNSQGGYTRKVSEAQWDAHLAKEIEAFERHAKQYDEDLAISDRQQEKIDEQNERFDKILDKWEEQQRRFDVILDRWGRLLDKMEAGEHGIPAAGTGTE
jgi:hypothetical protein